jgi:hypothetical protein
VKIPNRIIAAYFLNLVILGVVMRSPVYKRSRVCAELLNFTRLGKTNPLAKEVAQYCVRLALFFGLFKIT